METISKHELVPFTALMNMIKFNYLEKKEVFHTLLGILCDYDPTDEENRKRTTRYIELLLSDQAELAEYLLSFLPNGMSVDHIGVADIKGDKLKLKKKKPVKLHQTSSISTSTCTTSKTILSFQQSMVSSCKQAAVSNSKPLPPQVNLNIIRQNINPVDKPSIITTQSELDSSTKGHKSVSDFGIKEQNDNLQKTKILPLSNCSMNVSMGGISSQMNTVVNSSQVLSSDLPILYFNNSNQTPVCPVVPSKKLQNVIPRSSGIITSTYTSSQCEWLPYDTNKTPIQNQNMTSMYTNMCKEFSQNKPSQPVSTFSQINEDLETPNLISSTAGLLYESYDFSNYKQPSENLHFVQQHEPLLPNVRFPLHSTPKSNLKPTDVAFNRRPTGHDLLSLINQPMGDLHYQPITFSGINTVDRNMYSNSRTLSAFPYTQEFVFPDGKTQNLFVNRSGVPTDQNTYQNISKATSYNKNKPCSTYEKSNAPVYTELPRYDMIGNNTPTYTNVFHQNQIMAPRSYSSQLQNNSRHFFTPPTIPPQSLPRLNLIDTPQNLPRLPLIETPHDMLTPLQYNPEFNIVDPTMSNQDYDLINRLNQPKPKKLSMSANSSVRKKLRLTPNNASIP